MTTTTKIKLPKKLHLNLKTWRCGGNQGSNKHGRGLTQLLNEEGFSDALGQFLLRARAPQKLLRGGAGPCHRHIDVRLLRNKRGESFASEAIRINDDKSTNLSQKVDQLRELCETNGHTLEIMGDL